MAKKARALKRSTRQTGSSDSKRDKKRKALAPGKRRSKKGKIYYEYRRNRTDVKGRDSPKVKRSKRKYTPTKQIVKTPLGPERVYKDQRGNKYIIIGNKVKPIQVRR